jgi:hypothetical protein
MSQMTLSDIRGVRGFVAIGVTADKGRNGRRMARSLMTQSGHEARNVCGTKFQFTAWWGTFGKIAELSAPSVYVE